MDDGGNNQEQRILNLLNANIRGELAARRRMLELVEAEEQAVLASDRAAVELALEGLEVELSRAAELAHARAKLFTRLGSLWRVAPGALSLGSIAERLGPRGEPLAERRTELRALVAQLARRNRRLGALVALQRRVVREVVGAVLGEPDALRSTGSILSAEA